MGGEYWSIFTALKDDDTTIGIKTHTHTYNRYNITDIIYVNKQPLTYPQNVQILGPNISYIPHTFQTSNPQ